jgi:hypothetical protein
MEAELKRVRPDGPVSRLHEIELVLGVRAKGAGADCVLIVAADGEIEERGGGVGKGGEHEFRREQLRAAEGVLAVDLRSVGAAVIETQIIGQPWRQQHRRTGGERFGAVRQRGDEARRGEAAALAAFGRSIVIAAEDGVAGRERVVDPDARCIQR